MTEPPTVLIREPDDDRTLIDPRFSARSAERLFEASARAISPADGNSNHDALAEGARNPLEHLRAMLSGRRRRIVETGVVLALAFGLGSVAYQQRRAADALRDALEEMKVGRAMSPADGIARSGRRARAPVRDRSRVEISIPEVAAGEREGLERRGASLLGSNNFAGALKHYQGLVELFPHEATFGDVVTVLKAKLRCAEPVSSPCP